MPKKRTKKSALEDKLLKNPVLIVALAAVIMLLGYFGTQKFLDWQNKNMLIDFSNAYVGLVADVEEATGESLEITSDCFKTTEKFSEGKTVCGVLTAKNVDSAVLQSYREVLESTEGFKRGQPYRDVAGYGYEYKSADCQFNYTEKVRLDCLYPIRTSNQELAAELFSEEKLNTRKNELLNQ